MLLVFAIPVSQRILGQMPQLADCRLNPLAELDIQLDRANSVSVGIHELPPGGPSFSPRPRSTVQDQIFRLIYFSPITEFEVKWNHVSDALFSAASEEVTGDITG